MREEREIDWLIERARKEERERIARIISGLDNTMMNQAKLAEYIRKLEC